MRATARILTASRAEHLPVEQDGAISSIDPDSEYAHECYLRRETGWRRREGSTGLSMCECMIAKMQAECLSVIPERFKDSSFESYLLRSQRQVAALFLMRGEPGGSWYLTGLTAMEKRSC